MKPKSILEYAAFSVFCVTLAVLPRSVALRVGAAIGQVLYWVALPLRRIAFINLKIAFPGRSDAELRHIFAASCRNLGRVAAEVCHLGRLRPETVERYIEIADRDGWAKALRLAEERGAIIVTGHFGNWELLAYAHGLLGHPVSLVYKPMRNRFVDRAIARIRARAGTRMIAKRSAARAALRVLREGGLLVVPMDQNQRAHEGVFVDLYGKPACTNAGAMRLAVHTGAMLVPVFLVRQGETDRHRFEFLPEIEVADTGFPDRDLVATTQLCSDAVADMIRRYPEQWIWFHKRWRTRPGDEPAIY